MLVDNMFIIFMYQTPAAAAADLEEFLLYCYVCMHNFSSDSFFHHLLQNQASLVRPKNERFIRTSLHPENILYHQQSKELSN